MGRVSRYKKEKSTIRNFGILQNPDSVNDPVKLNKKRGRKGVEINGFELMPDSGRRKLIKKWNVKGPRENKKNTKNGIKKKSMERKNDEESNKKHSTDISQLKIKPGESMRDFSYRVDKHARDLVQGHSMGQTNSSIRRKQFMQEKSKKKKEKKRLKRENLLKRNSDDEDENELIYQGKLANPKRKGPETAQVQTRIVGLHEVVERPPELSEKSSKSRFTKLAFMKANGEFGTQKSGYEKVQMEAMRARVSKAYASMKKKKGR